MSSLPPQEIIDVLLARGAQNTLLKEGRCPIHATDLVELIPVTSDLEFWIKTAAYLSIFDWLDAIEQVFERKTQKTQMTANRIVSTATICREKYNKCLLSFPGVNIFHDLKDSSDSLRLTADFMPEIAEKMQGWYPLMGPAFESEFEEVAARLANRFPTGFNQTEFQIVRQVTLGDWMNLLEKNLMEQALPDAQGKFDLRLKRI